MDRQDLINYIKSQQQKGRSNEEIRNSLLGAGWQAQDIEDAFTATLGTITPNSSYGATAYSNTSSTSYLPGAGALLGESWEIYKNKLKTLLGIIGIQVLIMGVFIGILLAIAMLFSLFSSPFPHTSETQTAAINIINWLTGFVVILSVIGLLLLSQIWSQAAFIYAISSIENIGAIEAYKRSWHKLGSLVWTSLLSGIIIFIGLIFLIIPGILFAIWYMFVSYIVITEDVGGFSALSRSKEYVKGRIWEVLGLLLVMFLIIIAVSFGMQMITGIIGTIFVVLKLNFLNIILALINQIVSWLITPLATIYSFLIYKHLKQIKGSPINN